MKWCLLKKGKWEFLCAAFPLFFSRRMMTWILMYLQSNTPQPSPLFQLSLCFFSLGQGQKGQEQYINRTMNYQYIALDLSVLVLVCVFVFVVVLPVFVSLSSFMFLSLSLPLFLFLSCSGSCLSPCLCYCSRLCLCPRPCCCLCLIVPLLFFPAHQPVGGHEAALEHRI